MRKKNLFAMAVCLTMVMTGCEKDDVIEVIPEPEKKPEQTLPKDSVVEKTYLSLDVQLLPILTRRSGPIEEFIKGDELGVFGGTEKNVRYTYDGKEWKPDNPVEVEETGTVYAYYPYSPSVTSHDNIKVDITRQEDVLYGKAEVSKDIPTAGLVMRHALSLVRFRIVRDSYTGEGIVEDGMLRNAAAEGVMDGEGGVSPGSSKADLPLGYKHRLGDGEGETADAIVIPGTTEGTSVEFTIDGKRLTYDLSAGEGWERGRMYTYTLVLKGNSDTGPVYMENPPLDVEYWSTYGKTDEIRIVECDEEDNPIAVRPNYIKYGRATYRNEGRPWGLWIDNLDFNNPFKGEMRFVLMDGDRIADRFPPEKMDIEPFGEIGGMWRCYVTADPGIYRLMPLFRREGKSGWFKPLMDFPEEWMYTVKDAPDDLPAVRLLEVEDLGKMTFHQEQVFNVPDEGTWPLQYTLGNKAGVHIKGEIKAVWERDFRADGNTYGPSHLKANPSQHSEWNDTIGSVTVDIPAGCRNWRGIIDCSFPVKREEETDERGISSCSPMVHLYWKGEGSDEWVLMRTDSDALFDRQYDGLESWECKDKAANFISLEPASW